MKIAVYSGSFNPLHIGHKAIVEYLTDRLSFDAVYLIVSPRNPLKEASADASGQARFKAAQEAVARHGLKAKVDDIELFMPSPQYTIRTLDALRSREPENEFTLVIGADNLAKFRNWRDYKRILTEYGVLVYPRRGYDMVKLRDELMGECTAAHYRIALADDAPLVDISSTQIREGLAAGRDMSAVMLQAPRPGKA